MRFLVFFIISTVMTFFMSYKAVEEYTKSKTRGVGFLRLLSVFFLAIGAILFLSHLLTNI